MVINDIEMKLLMKVLGIYIDLPTYDIYIKMS